VAEQNELLFNGATVLTDVHDKVKSLAGNDKWFHEFLPVAECPRRRTGREMLWLFHRLGLCCSTVGHFTVTVAGILRSDPDIIIIYMAYNQHNLFHQIAVLL
jgi:triphosphoribosyl-dephospho-CoA synthetase